MFLIFRAVVMIKVRDIDEFAPKFENTSYFVTIEEGQIHDMATELLRFCRRRSRSSAHVCAFTRTTTLQGSAEERIAQAALFLHRARPAVEKPRLSKRQRRG